MILSITGHRPDKLGGYEAYQTHHELKLRLIEAFTQLSVTEGIVGGAQGADTLAAEAFYAIGIPYTVAIPFKGQEKFWHAPAQERYNTILENAARIVVVCQGGYAAWKMQKRNIWMVDNGDALLAVWDGSKGGTYNCIQYAKNRTPIYYIPVTTENGQVAFGSYELR